jgi:hypothetical protein
MTNSEATKYTKTLYLQEPEKVHDHPPDFMQIWTQLLNDDTCQGIEHRIAEEYSEILAGTGTCQEIEKIMAEEYHDIVSEDSANNIETSVRNPPAHHSFLRKWIDMMKESQHFEAMVGILLLSLPNIEYLKYEYMSSFDAILTWIFTTSGRVQRQNPTLSFALSHLNEIDMSIEAVEDLIILVPILELPSLRRFTCQGLGVYDFFDGEIELQHQSSVKELCILDYTFYD